MLVVLWQTLQTTAGYCKRRCVCLSPAKGTSLLLHVKRASRKQAENWRLLRGSLRSVSAMFCAP